MMTTRRRGLTLVELLVVIAIIGVLTAVLIPAVVIARHAADRSACLSNLHQLAIALNAYGNDYGGHMPPVYGPDDADGQPQAGWNFTTTLQTSTGGLALLFRWPADYAEAYHMHGLPYLPSAHVMVCPADRFADSYRTPWGLTGFDYRGRPVATAAGGTLGFASYVDLYGSGPAAAAGRPDLAPFAGLERYKLAAADPARRAILTESTLWYGGNTGRGDYPAIWWHGHGGNVLYLDGHATWVPIDAVRPTLAAVQLDDSVGRGVALLRALDR